jgi:hypothetical protein
VVVLDMTVQSNFSITNALLRLAPKKVLRGLFDGGNIKLDFEGEGFFVDGKSVPWRNVRKVYNGPKRAMQTRGTPEKRED